MKVLALAVGVLALISCEKILGDKEELNKPETIQKVIGCWHTKYNGYDFHVTFYDNMTVQWIQYMDRQHQDLDDWIMMDGLLQWETRDDRTVYIFETGDTESYWSKGEIHDGKTMGLTLNDPNSFVTFKSDPKCDKGPHTKDYPTPPANGSVNEPDTVNQIVGTWRIEVEDSYLREIVFKEDMTAEEIRYKNNDHEPAIHYTWKTIDQFLIVLDEAGNEVEVGQIAAPNLIRLNPNQENARIYEMLKPVQWIPNSFVMELRGRWEAPNDRYRYRSIELESDNEYNPTIARVTEADGTTRVGRWEEYGREARVYFDQEWDRERDLRFILHQGNHYDETLKIFPGFTYSEEYYPRND